MRFCEIMEMLSENPYLIRGVIKLFLHIFSGPEDFCLTRAILALIKKNHAIQIIGSKPSRSNGVSHCVFTRMMKIVRMQPSDLLNSLQFDAVTNGRASDDYEGGSNWDVGGASLLFWAMGMRPSKDNFWSGDGQKRQMGFSQPNPGTAPLSLDISYFLNTFSFI